MTEQSKPKTRETIIAELKEQHGDRIAFAKLPDGSLAACRPPSSGEHARVSDKVGDPRKSDYSAQKEYVYACRIYPEIDAFVAMVGKYPGLVQALTGGIADLAGASIEIETGK